MSTPQELDRLLSECCEKLVDCTSAITDLPLANHRENVYRIAEVSEVRSDLYKAYPDLKPDLWDEAPSENHFREWFEEAQRIANVYCAEGAPQKAIATYQSFVFVGPPEQYEFLAKNAIKAIRKTHGV